MNDIVLVTECILLASSFPECDDKKRLLELLSKLLAELCKWSRD